MKKPYRYKGHTIERGYYSDTNKGYLAKADSDHRWYIDGDHRAPGYGTLAYARAIVDAIVNHAAQTSEAARTLGSMTSEAKARAARENGKRGGRPRKAQEKIRFPA